MKKIIIFFLISIASIFLTGCFLSPKTNLNQPGINNQLTNQSNEEQNIPPVYQEGQATVLMKDFVFQPASLTVKKGTLVTWENKDNASHSIITDPRPTYTELKSLNSYILAPGQSWSFTFDVVGRYGYKCGLHPTMIGSVIVIE